METRWYNLTVEQTLRDLDSSLAGLSHHEAGERLARYGRNELKEKPKTPPVLVFLRQFASPLIYILLVAAAVEIVILRKTLDAAVILGVVVINSVIGFIQETGAERAMEALKKLTAPQARVRREGTGGKSPRQPSGPRRCHHPRGWG